MLHTFISYRFAFKIQIQIQFKFEFNFKFILRTLEHFLSNTWGGKDFQILISDSESSHKHLHSTTTGLKTTDWSEITYFTVLGHTLFRHILVVSFNSFHACARCRGASRCTVDLRNPVPRGLRQIWMLQFGMCGQFKHVCAWVI